jgi:hypothetical protein
MSCFFLGHAWGRDREGSVCCLRCRKYWKNYGSA